LVRPCPAKELAQPELAFLPLAGLLQFDMPWGRAGGTDMENLVEAVGDQTFIRVAEVWTPDGDNLHLASGEYGALSCFAEASRKTSFAKGEGLPGRAWGEQRPILMSTQRDAGFVRSEAATEAGLTSAVAIPVFAASELKAVLVVMCGADAHHAGAIEIWEDRDDKLQLDDGYYGHAESFAAVSREISFGRGQGLPGGVWAANTPILLRDLGRMGSFLRSRQASDIGLKTGLGVPIPVPGSKRYVLTLLSGPRTPIARRFELWDARAQRIGSTRRAVLADGICERDGPLWPQLNPPVDQVSVGAWDGPVGRVLGSGLPYVQASGPGLPAGYTQMIALPIYRETELAHVVAWYL
jgi:hypothetical protein